MDYNRRFGVNQSSTGLHQCLRKKASHHRYSTHNSRIIDSYQPGFTASQEQIEPEPSRHMEAHITKLISHHQQAIRELELELKKSQNCKCMSGVAKCPRKESVINAKCSRPVIDRPSQKCTAAAERHFCATGEEMLVGCPGTYGSVHGAQERRVPKYRCRRCNATRSDL